MRYFAPTELTATHRKVIDEDAPSWVIEELTDPRPRAVRHGSNRWVGVAIGVAVAAVGFGFVSHITDPAPTPGSQAAAGATAGAPASAKVTAPSTTDDTAVIAPMTPLVISSPVRGATVDGGLVEVRGVAERPLGGVHLSIVLGDAVLGWTNLEIDQAGPFRTEVPIYAPAFEVPAVLRIEGLALGIEPGRSLSIDLHLNAGAPVGLWRAGLAPSAPDTVLISGFAPLPTGRVARHSQDRDRAGPRRARGRRECGRREARIGRWSADRTRLLPFAVRPRRPRLGPRGRTGRRRVVAGPGPREGRERSRSRSWPDQTSRR